jgi:hypothetical protein
MYCIEFYYYRKNIIYYINANKIMIKYYTYHWLNLFAPKSILQTYIGGVHVVNSWSQNDELSTKFLNGYNTLS